MDSKIFLKNAFFGLLYGAVFVLMNLVASFSIALPVIGLSIADSLRFLVVGVLAPIVEEVAFAAIFVALYFIFRKKFIPALIITSLAFGFYHYQAYNAQIGSIVAAMIFRAVAIIILFWRKTDFSSFDNTSLASGIISLIVMHMVFNIYLLGKTGLFVVGF